MGRLKPGVGLPQAQANLATLAKDFEKEYPNAEKNVGVFVTPVWGAHYGVQDYMRSALGFLMVVAVFVLLIGCVNVANLLLARASSREKEFAIRAAMGAGRSRLIRQLLTECLLLAAAGGAGGVLIALWGANLLAMGLPPTHLPMGLQLRVDLPVLAFTLVLSIATGIIFGLAPAWRSSRADLNRSLKDGGRTSGMSSGHRVRDLLVVSEMVLATVLLVGAGLLLRSLHKMEEAGPGFRSDHVTLAAFDLRVSGYSADQASLFYERLTEKLRGTPGVESASFERFVPLWFTGRMYAGVHIEGYTPKPNEDMGIDLNWVGPDYFRMIEIPLVAGRDFSDRDNADGPQVVIVNQTMANRFWPGQNAVGHRMRVEDRWWSVAGVARDIKYHRMNEPPQSFMYRPALQFTATDTNVLVRTQMPAAATIKVVRAAAASLDSKVQPLESDTLDGLLHVSLFANRTAATIAAILGALGMLLAALGIYGVLSYSVSQRVREIGIRVALGAQSTDIVGMIVGHGLRLALFGAAVGAAAGLALTQGMTSLLYGVSTGDPETFLIVTAILAAVAALAAYIPARRAMRVDPMVALRYE
jgi:predicted permease